MVYPKFKKDEDCAFPERKICNWDETLGPYMKYDNSKSIFSPERWRCIYKKEEKSINSDKKEDSSQGKMGGNCRIM
jgi:hypothetical protein